MEISDFEHLHATDSTSSNELLAELLKLTIHNNSLLRVILANQAHLYHRIDSTVDPASLIETWIHDAKELTNETKVKILTKLAS